MLTHVDDASGAIIVVEFLGSNPLQAGSLTVDALVDKRRLACHNHAVLHRGY